MDIASMTDARKTELWLMGMATPLHLAGQIEMDVEINPVELAAYDQLDPALRMQEWEPDRNTIVAFVHAASPGWSRDEVEDACDDIIRIIKTRQCG